MQTVRDPDLALWFSVLWVERSDLQKLLVNTSCLHAVKVSFSLTYRFIFFSPCSLSSSSSGRFCFIPNLSFLPHPWVISSLLIVVYWYFAALLHSAHLPLLSRVCFLPLSFSLCKRCTCQNMTTSLVNTHLPMALLSVLNVKEVPITLFHL